jgi:hypothetical protein
MKLNPHSLDRWMRGGGRESYKIGGFFDSRENWRVALMYKLGWEWNMSLSVWLRPLISTMLCEYSSMWISYDDKRHLVPAQWELCGIQASVHVLIWTTLQCRGYLGGEKTLFCIGLLACISLDNKQSWVVLISAGLSTLNIFERRRIHSLVRERA